MSIHDGHRMRIIEKIDKDVLKEHEYLEILLFNAIPRRNTNDISHKLLGKFGSIQNMFSATVEELQTVEGVGPSVAAYLKCIGVFFEKYRSRGEMEYTGIFEPEKFLAFVKKHYKNEENEIFDVYFLDGKEIFAGEEWDAVTVDGVHPNDFGFFRFAQKLETIIKPLLENGHESECI